MKYKRTKTTLNAVCTIESLEIFYLHYRHRYYMRGVIVAFIIIDGPKGPMETGATPRVISIPGYLFSTDTNSFCAFNLGIVCKMKRKKKCRTSDKECLNEIHAFTLRTAVILTGFYFYFFLAHRPE